MEVKRLYLDANILILMGEGLDTRTALLAEIVASVPASQPTFLCTSELTLAELLVKPYRDEDDRLIAQYESWLVPGGFLEISSVTSFVLRHAAALRAQHKALKLADGIHIASAIGLNCSHLLSADKRLPSKIELLETRWLASRAYLDILAPEIDVLGGILKGQIKA